MIQSHRPQRLLCLYIPHFRACVEKRDHSETRAPVIVYRLSGHPLVLDACDGARDRGVREGMLLSQALSHCPQALAVPEREEIYRQANLSAVRPMLNLTPEVEVADLGLAYMNVEGLNRLGGDERVLSRRLVEAVRAQGYSPRIAVARSRFAARMLARYGGEGERLLVAEKEQQFIAHLPVQVLPEPDAAWRKVKERLHLLGLCTALGEIDAEAVATVEASEE